MDEERDDAGAVDLGVEMLDAEHRGQLERMEELERAIRDTAARPELSARLEELIRYLEAHLMSEQIAMREHAYPAYEAHVREHEDAIELLRDLEAPLLARRRGGRLGGPRGIERLADQPHPHDGSFSGGVHEDEGNRAALRSCAAPRRAR